MWWSGTDAAKAEGFVGFKSIRELRRTKLSDVPQRRGVYLVVRAATTLPVFLAMSVGGYFKGKNPTVESSLLKEKWVPGAAAVYVGKAGGKGATLRSRLGQYLKFGDGRPVGHRGGRYIWQIKDCESLLVCWKVTEGEAPEPVERRMLDEFTAAFGRLPFANCRRESSRR